MKYNSQMVKDICSLVATGDYTIVDICKQVGISESVYYKWKEDHLEFVEALKEADKKRLESFRNMARSGLAKLLNGYEYEEVSQEGYTEGGKLHVKSIKKTKKFIPPNPTAVIFTLTNTDAGNFTHKSEVKHSGDAVFNFNLVQPDKSE